MKSSILMLNQIMHTVSAPFSQVRSPPCLHMSCSVPSIPNGGPFLQDISRGLCQCRKRNALVPALRRRTASHCHSGHSSDATQSLRYRGFGTYRTHLESLDDLVVAYTERKALDIAPTVSPNHGPATSIYCTDRGRKYRRNLGGQL
jgi:hypothetical protein